MQREPFYKFLEKRIEGAQYPEIGGAGRRMESAQVRTSRKI